MKSALRDFDRLRGAGAGDAVDQPVLVGDAARPPALVIAAQRLRLGQRPVNGWRRASTMSVRIFAPISSTQ